MIMIKKIFGFVCIVFLGWVMLNYDLIRYGYDQAKDQLHIVFNTKPVQEIMGDPQVADSIKMKLALIQEIRAFATDSLGIHESENYTTFFDQKGKPILWLLTASKPYSLKAKKWHFPILGSVSYKGFFDLEKAKLEEAQLKEEGYDTNIGTVSGWSTLGWLKDPVLSGMLTRSEGSLANLIIHELTHGTLYVKDSVVFNENLATFIGDKGAERFLSYKYGKDSSQLQSYLDEKYDREKFVDHVIRGAFRLDSLYNTFHAGFSDYYQNYLKQKLISEIKAKVDTLQLKQPSGYVWFTKEDYMPNNAFFMGYLRYNQSQDDFEELFDKDFGSDLAAFLSFFKEKYPSL
jgi:predicted aminopeptidase